MKGFRPEMAVLGTVRRGREVPQLQVSVPFLL